MEKYFAYGSNLSFIRFLSRCPSAKIISKAILKGYKLIFPLYDLNWKGGVAGISQDNSNHVEGVIYEISYEDLKKLDTFEDVHKGDYYRKILPVILPDRTVINSWIYIANKMDGAPYKPSSEYKNTIINGAVEQQLSDEYIEMLKNI